MTLSTSSVPRPGSIYDTWRPAALPPAVPCSLPPAANSRPACPTPERIMASVAQAYGIGLPSRRRDPYAVDAKGPSINKVVTLRCPHLWRTAGLLLTLYPDGP